MLLEKAYEMAKRALSLLFSICFCLLGLVLHRIVLQLGDLHREASSPLAGYVDAFVTLQAHLLLDPSRHEVPGRWTQRRMDGAEESLIGNCSKLCFDLRHSMGQVAANRLSHAVEQLQHHFN